jgi:hypothetical protein
MYKQKYFKYKDKYLLLKDKQKFNTFSNLFNTYGGKTKTKLESRIVYLNQDILKDELLLEIPIDMILTDDDGKNAPIWRLKTEEKNNNLVGILYYMDKISSNTNLFIRSYLNILPESFDGIPCFWEERYYQYLKNTSFYEPIIKRNIDLNKSFKNMNHSLLKIYQMSFNDYLKYKALVSSRNFGFVKDNKKLRGMVPFGDMMNHSLNPNTKWGFDNKTNRFYFRSNKDLVKGEILTDTYGLKPSYQYLIYYGFFLPENHQVLFNGKILDRNHKVKNSEFRKKINEKIILLKKDLELIKNEINNQCKKIIIKIIETEIIILSNIIYD